MVSAAKGSPSVQARWVPALPEAVTALLETQCRCHAAKRGEVELRSTPRSHAAEPRLAGHLLRPLLEHVRRHAHKPGNLLDSYADLDKDERVHVSVVEALLREARPRLADPSLGLSALAELARGDGDAVEFAAESAPNLEGALTTLIRHADRLCDVAELHLYVEHGLAAIELRYACSLSQMLHDFLLGALVKLLGRWLGALGDFEIWLAEPLETTRSAYVEAFAPASVRVGSRCDALVFPAARLTERLSTADAALHAVLLRVLEHSMPADAGPAPLSVRVTRVLGPRLATADGNVEGVARTLALSARSLARKLQAEGVTFSELLENMRRERALHYIERSNLTVERIAHLLGYSTTSAFHRAFVRWYGRSPVRARREAAGRQRSL